MKRWTAFLCILLILITLTGCNATEEWIDFSADDVNEVTMYYAPVPTAAQKMTVDDPQDVGMIVNALHGVRVLGAAQDADAKAGGSVQFRFLMNDGTVRYVGTDGGTLQMDVVQYKAQADDLFDLWDSLDYEKHRAAEAELPLYSPKSPPILQIKYAQGSDTYCFNASINSGTWTFQNDDGMRSTMVMCGMAPEDMLLNDFFVPVSLGTGVDQLLLRFSTEPDSYEVNCYPVGEEYGGGAAVDAPGGIITLPEREGGMLYLVHATWPAGEVTYAWLIE